MTQIMNEDLIQTNVSQIEKFIQEVEVHNEEDRERALNAVKRIKFRKAQIVDFFKDSKTKAHQAWKAICKNEATFTERLDQAEDLVKKIVLAYDKKIEAKEEAERIRLQAIEDEKTRKEQERLRKQAEKVKTPEKKEALLEQAESVQSPEVVFKPRQEVRGVSKRANWKYRVVDPEIIPRDYLIIDDKKLTALARATSGQMDIPGIEFYKEDTLAVKMS